ncbi:MAG TPA: hypothetical protein VFO70_03600, partial [Chitinophagaceae bacterium]|nr:hypothetical protein [Chitinophagaceae bacterium]
MGKQNQYPFILKAAFLWLCQLLLCLPTPGQTTNISGIVNTYHRIIEVIPSRACVRVSSVAGLSPSAKVMIVQMKGATINTTSNNINWGDTTSLNNAGNYEINYICFVRGDSVFLVYNLLNSYTAPAGKVQLITFGSYQ